MKALVQDRYGPADVLHLRDMEKPALADDRVLIRVRAASVNALDYHMMRGQPYIGRTMMGWRRPEPAVRGADLAGVIEEVGKSVTRLRPGDEVFGSGRGTFAEYATGSEKGLVPKPSRLTFEQAAAVPTAGLTALQGLRDHAKLEAGQRVLVYGAGGGVGTLSVEIAKALGAHVTAVSGAGNLNLLRSVGADEVLDYAQGDFTRNGAHYDVFFDIGGNRSFHACRRILTPKGTLVSVGGPGGRFFAPMGRMVKTRILSPFVSQRLVGFIAQVGPKDLNTLRELADAGKLTPVIDRTYPLSEAADAIRYAETGHAQGKVVIRVG